MSLLDKIFWYFKICPSCYARTNSWSRYTKDIQVCHSNECGGYKAIDRDRPKKYKYRLRYKYRITYLVNNGPWRIRDCATYKYYWLAWLNLIFNRFVDKDIFTDRKYWISKEEIGRKRNKK